MADAISNCLFGIIYLLISNPLFLSFILFFVLFLLKLMVYWAKFTVPLERMGIEFCSIGFAIFWMAIFDKSSKLHQHFDPEGITAQAALIIALIFFVPIYMLAVHSFKMSQMTTSGKMRRYGYLGFTFPLGFLMVFLGLICA